MPIDFSSNVYAPNYAVFSRQITIDPLVSQPGHQAYLARGIYNTVAIDVMALDGSIVSEQRTILDILDADFSVMPVQHDRVIIPADGTIPPLGDFEITDTKSNGGGETTLDIRKIMQTQP
jgi:hypothetical protein